MPAEHGTPAEAARAGAGPSVDVALFLVASLLCAEAGYARLAGAPAGTVDHRLLLAIAGCVLALVGLLVCLRHWSVRHALRRTPHPVWHGLIALWGGLSFAMLYLAALYVPIPLEREDVLLIAIVESVILLWLLGWLAERSNA